jgi:hypothetical protein
VPPGRIPVLARHVADDEGRDRLEATLGVRVEEIGEPFEYLLVEALRLRNEVRPVAERASDRAAVLSENPELLADDFGAVLPPHARSASARPEVGADPRRRNVLCLRRRRLGSCPRSHPGEKSPSLIRFSVNRSDTQATDVQACAAVRRRARSPSAERAGPVLPRGVSSPIGVSTSAVVRPSMTSTRCRMAVTP